MHNGYSLISNSLRHRVHRKSACKIHIQNYNARPSVRRSSPLSFIEHVKSDRARCLGDSGFHPQITDLADLQRLV